MGRGRQRGFALLIVLWSVVLLSTGAATLLASARSDTQLARNLRTAAVLEAAADGAIYRAAFHVIDRAWAANGRPIAAGPGLVVCISDEAGKINPNTANPALIATLLGVLGADRTTAQRLSEAIFGWRDGASAQLQAAAYRAAGLPYTPPGTPFTSVDDLRLVLGMTPTLFARLRPNLTVWYTGDPNPAAAPPPVATALRQLLGNALPAPIAGTMPDTVAITALASGPDAGRFTREAVLRLGAGATQSVRVLDWQQGEAAASCTP